MGRALIHTGVMFDKKVPTEAQILADEGSGNVVDTDMHGVDWDHHKYILEVRPPGETPVRVETKAKVPIFHAPQPGDILATCPRPRATTHEPEPGRRSASSPIRSTTPEGNGQAMAVTILSSLPPHRPDSTFGLVSGQVPPARGDAAR